MSNPVKLASQKPPPILLQKRATQPDQPTLPAPRMPAHHDNLLPPPRQTIQPVKNRIVPGRRHPVRRIHETLGVPAPPIQLLPKHQLPTIGIGIVQKLFGIVDHLLQVGQDVREGGEGTLGATEHGGLVVVVVVEEVGDEAAEGEGDESFEHGGDDSGALLGELFGGDGADVLSKHAHDLVFLVDDIYSVVVVATVIIVLLVDDQRIRQTVHGVLSPPLGKFRNVGSFPQHEDLVRQPAQCVHGQILFTNVIVHLTIVVKYGVSRCDKVGTDFLSSDQGKLAHYNIVNGDEIRMGVDLLPPVGFGGAAVSPDDFSNEGMQYLNGGI
mmetsp:Transcript_11890/g.22586  ORF Transcript_11890/g.22586 Transcript_11890/m.22586 type:complete len:326 (-) Transcript_11890:731-1708(-)